MHDSLQPSPWIQRFAAAIPPQGPVLDVACGAGRHTRLFAAAGHDVTAVDQDLRGVADLAETPGIRLIQADLEDGSPWPLGAQRFGCVVVTNYLHRPTFPAILAAVADGGVLLYETFMRGNEKLGKPTNPAFLLEPDELIDLVAGQLHIVAFEQGLVRRGAAGVGQPAVIQRICAARPLTPSDTDPVFSLDVRIDPLGATD